MGCFCRQVRLEPGGGEVQVWNGAHPGIVQLTGPARELAGQVAGRAAEITQAGSGLVRGVERGKGIHGLLADGTHRGWAGVGER